MSDPAPTGGLEAELDVEAKPSVEGFDRTSGASEEVEPWVAIAQTTLVGEGINVGQLDLILVDEDEMAELNETHMGHSGPTDVLSFPLDSDESELVGSDVPVHLGDVVLCPSVARAQAPDHCGSTESEMSLLVIHGVLHILGHDHAEPEETHLMRERERFHLARLGYEHPEPV